MSGILLGSKDSVLGKKVIFFFFCQWDLHDKTHTVWAAGKKLVEVGRAVATKSQHIYSTSSLGRV